MLIVKTPYRVSFAGGGTDFPEWFTEHSGAVVSATISRYCYLMVRELPPFFPHRNRVVWSRIELVDNVDDIEHPAVKGCLQFMDFKRPRLQIHHDGDLPAQSGTGSSAAFTVGLLQGLYALKGQMVSKRQLAMDAIMVERDLIGETCGLQDQCAAAFGGLNLITFGPEPHDFNVNRLPITNGTAHQLQSHLMLFYTKQQRTASEIEAAKWLKPNYDALREQQKLAGECLAVLNSADMKGLASILDMSWSLKKAMSNEVTNDDIDRHYSQALAAGAWGGKLCGAGAGGCLLLVVPLEKQSAVKFALADCVHIPFRLDGKGSEIIYYEAGLDNMDNEGARSKDDEPHGGHVAG